MHEWANVVAGATVPLQVSEGADDRLLREVARLVCGDASAPKDAVKLTQQRRVRPLESVGDAEFAHGTSSVAPRSALPARRLE